MPRHMCLIALSLSVPFAFTSPSSAQTDEPRVMLSMMPLRADEVIVDTDKDNVLIRGNIDWPDGRTTTSVVIECSGKSRMLIVSDRNDEMTDDRLADFDAALCNQLASHVQRRK